MPTRRLPRPSLRNTLTLDGATPGRQPIWTSCGPSAAATALAPTPRVESTTIRAGARGGPTSARTRTSARAARSNDTIAAGASKRIRVCHCTCAYAAVVEKSTSPPPSNIVREPCTSRKAARTSTRAVPSGESPSGVAVTNIRAGAAPAKTGPLGNGVGGGDAVGTSVVAWCAQAADIAIAPIDANRAPSFRAKTS